MATFIAGTFTKLGCRSALVATALITNVGLSSPADAKRMGSRGAAGVGKDFGAGSSAMFGIEAFVSSGAGVASGT